MSEKWDRIFETSKYLKKFLKEYQKTYERISGGYENISSLTTDKYNTLVFDKSLCIDNDFNLFIYDFKNLLEKTKFTQLEKKYLELWMLGYSCLEIGDYFGTTKRNAINKIISCCNKIRKERNK